MASRFLHLVRHGDATEHGDLTPAGEQQARLVGRRLAKLPISTIHHSPIHRAARTAHLISEQLPGVPLRPCDALGDFVPSHPDPSTVPDAYTAFLDEVSPDEFLHGAALAAQAVEQHAVPAEQLTHEMIVSHNFLIGWFVAHAMSAPAWRWMGVNQSNCVMTTILYRSDRPPALVAMNEMGHLPPSLRWTDSKQNTGSDGTGTTPILRLQDGQAGRDPPRTVPGTTRPAPKRSHFESDTPRRDTGGH